MSSIPSNTYGSPAASSLGGPGYQGLQRRTLKRLDYLSVGKLFGVLYGLLGLIFGAFFFVIAIFGVTVGNGDAMGIVGGILLAVFFPIANGVSGFIGGVILAAFYNLAASVVGGIEFDLE